MGNVKITVLYDNQALNPTCERDWGFSCLIEVSDKKILFDTGGNGLILMENMKKLDVNPKDVTDVFLSHNHFDHIGGLSYFLNANRDVTVHVPPSIKGIKWAKKVISYDKPQMIYDGIFTTGELNNIEQSLMIRTDKGFILVVGCMHAGLELILRTAKHCNNPYYLIGGLHDFNKFHLLKRFQFVSPMHCTKHIEEIKFLHPDRYVEGGVGKVFIIE